MVPTYRNSPINRTRSLLDNIQIKVISNLRTFRMLKLSTD